MDHVRARFRIRKILLTNLRRDVLKHNYQIWWTMYDASGKQEADRR